MKLLRNDYKAELVAIGTRPNKGRTHYLCEYLKDSLNDGKKVLLITFDSSKEEILFRTKEADTSNLIYYNSAIKEFSTINKLIDTNKPDIVFIDYLNLLPNNESSIIDLSNISKDKNIPIVAIFQLSMRFDYDNLDDVSDDVLLSSINNIITSTADVVFIAYMKSHRLIKK